MSDAVAAHIAREAKSLHQGLKELLKTRDVLDREIEIQRKNLRRQYLRLLLVHPYAKESRDAETHLWMQTSYSLISIYKQKIASLDRAIQHPPRQQPQGQSHHSHSHPPNRTVEYRKLLQRFRQFLAEEEKFWTQLIVRLRRNFALDNTQGALTSLGLTHEDPTAQSPPPPLSPPTTTEEPSPTGSNGNHVPSMASPPLPGQGGPGQGQGQQGQNGRRNHYQFPPESDTPNPIHLPTTAAQRESRMAILVKAIVCLGDIARYKEQYNESGGRPRAGHEDGPPAVAASNGRNNGRGRRGGAQGGGAAPVMPRMRNYERARECYEQARLLVPHDGNPSHQLAILASYQKDIFNSLFHYYRALCVKQPWDTAMENLALILRKQLDAWKAKTTAGQGATVETTIDDPTLPHRLRAESFKEKVIVLHAQWRLGVEDTEGLSDTIIKLFDSLISGKVLPPDMISKAIVLAQSALWKHRMLRQTSTSSSEKKSQRSPYTETRIATHLLALHRVLLRIAIAELATPPEDAVENDLAMGITAIFRRTLPALRMAGKWIRANVRYLAQARESRDVHPHELQYRDSFNHHNLTSSRSTKDHTGKNNDTPVVIIDGLRAFWGEYVTFANALLIGFPAESLPALSAPLEEDIEMAGFLPLRKYMFAFGGEPNGKGSSASTPLNGMKGIQEMKSKVHPNEECLMRIADILDDATAVAEDEVSPLELAGGRLIVIPWGTSASPFPEAPRVSDTLPEYDDWVNPPKEVPITLEDVIITRDSDVRWDVEDSASEFSRDDPVGDAVRAVVDNPFEEDEYDDVIVMGLGDPASPPSLTPGLPNPTTPKNYSPTSPRSPYRSPRGNTRLDPIAPFQPLESVKTPMMNPLQLGNVGTIGSAGPTASDILDSFHNPQISPHISPVGVPSPTAPHTTHPRRPSNPTAPLVFVPGGTMESIWAPSANDSPLANANPTTAATTTAYQSSATLGGTPYLPAHQSYKSPVVPAKDQGTWSNHSLLESSAHILGPTVSPSSLGYHHRSTSSISTLGGGHFRTPSESLLLPRDSLSSSSRSYTQLSNANPSRRHDLSMIDHQAPALPSSFSLADQIQHQHQLSQHARIPTQSLNLLSGQGQQQHGLYKDTIYSASPNPLNGPSFYQHNHHQQHQQQQHHQQLQSSRDPFSGGFSGIGSGLGGGIGPIGGGLNLPHQNDLKTQQRSYTSQPPYLASSIWGPSG